MANSEHFAIFEQGVEVWNKWREDNPEIIPNLIGVIIRRKKQKRITGSTSFEGFWKMLSEKDINDINAEDIDRGIDHYINYNFSNTNLRYADMRGESLKGVDFQKANLKNVKFQGADLTCCNFSGAILNYVEYDDEMKCRFIDVSNCQGSQRFVRHVKDLDYIEETKEKHPVKYWWWKLLTDCGRSWLKLLGWCVAVLYVFWAIFDLLHVHDSLVTSIMAFTSFGFVDSNAHNFTELTLICIEAMLGYVMFGALVSLIASQIGRRS